MPDPDVSQEVTIPIEEIVSRLGRWLVVVAALVFGPLVVFRGLPEMPPWPLSSVWLGDAARWVAILLGAYVLSVPVHEGLHAVGMVATGSRWSDISFGARLRHGIVYVHCSEPMSVAAYRIVLLLPVVVTGFIPAVVAWFTGNGSVAAYAYLMTVSAIGDFEMFWRLRALGRDLLVRDHPSLLGCEILGADRRVD